MGNNARPVFITGATGSIGSALARRLSESGRPVRALVRNPARAAVLSGLSNIEIVPGDLEHPDSLRGCLDSCSLVYHSAANISGINRARFHAVNVVGTRTVVDEAIRSGVERFVHLSSIAVYGLGPGENIAESFPWTPSDQPYIVTKRAAERLVSEAANRMPVSIARIGDVFGPGQTTWTVDQIKRINEGSVQPPADAASGFLNLVYIDNLIDALLLMGTHPAAAGQTFNVVDGAPLLASEYIRGLMKLAGKKPVGMPPIAMKVATALLMAGDLIRGKEPWTSPGAVDFILHKATFSAAKIRAELGWRPAVEQAEAFRRTEEWLRRESYVH